MKLSKEEVQKIATLARLEISDEETEKYAGELSAILDYADQLSEVDTKDVEPIAHVTGATTKLREDKPEVFDDPEGLIDAAPDSSEGHVRVKKVL